MDWTNYTFQIAKQGLTTNPPPEFDELIYDGVYTYTTSPAPNFYRFTNGSATLELDATIPLDNYLQLTAGGETWTIPSVSDSALLSSTFTNFIETGGAIQNVEIVGIPPLPVDLIDWSLYKFTVTKDGATINPPPNFEVSQEGDYWITNAVNIGNFKIYEYINNSGATLKLVQTVANGDVRFEWFSESEDSDFIRYDNAQVDVLAGLVSALHTEVFNPGTGQLLDITATLVIPEKTVSNVSAKGRMPRQQTALIQYARGVASETGNEGILALANLFAADVAASRNPSKRSAVTIQKSKNREAQLRSAISFAVSTKTARTRTIATVGDLAVSPTISTDELKGSSIRVRMRGRPAGKSAIFWYEVEMQTVADPTLPTELERISVTTGTHVWVYPIAFYGRKVAIRTRVCGSNANGKICSPWSPYRIVTLVDPFNDPD